MRESDIFEWRVEKNLTNRKERLSASRHNYSGEMGTKSKTQATPGQIHWDQLCQSSFSSQNTWNNLNEKRLVWAHGFRALSPSCRKDIEKSCLPCGSQEEFTESTERAITKHFTPQRWWAASSDQSHLPQSTYSISESIIELTHQ